jgi:hypothetical protein
MIKQLARRIRRAFAHANRRIKSSDGLMHLLLLLRKAALFLLVLIFLVFEEIWDALHNLLVWREHYGRGIAAVNRYLQDRNRYAVLGTYLSLFVPMEILGLLAAALVGSGHPGWAILVYLSKGLIAIPAIDIFIGNKEKLLSFSAINYGYTKLLQLKKTSVYLNTVSRLKRLKLWVRTQIHNLFGRDHS